MASTIESIPYMREALLENVKKQLEVAAVALQHEVQANVPWQPQSNWQHTRARGYPNDNADQQIRVQAFSAPEEDRVGIAVYHPKKTVFTGSKRYGAFYYGAVLELGRKGRRGGRTVGYEDDESAEDEDDYWGRTLNEVSGRGGDGALEGYHYLEGVLREDVEPLVNRYLRGAVLNSVGYAGASAPKKPKARSVKFKGRVS